MVQLSNVLRFSLENKFSGTGHEDVIVTFAEFDVERTTIHDNLRLATSSTCDKCSNSCCASTCTTGLSDAAATFPDAGADCAVSLDTSKLDIATLREGGMMFKNTPCLAHLIHIVCEDDVVGIAH